MTTQKVFLNWALFLFIGWGSTALSANALPKKFSEPDTIYSQVDVIPQFSGGISGWSKFLNSNLNVSRLQESMDEDSYISFGFVQKADVEFTVCEDGKICDIEVLNASKVSPEFSEEVLRVMKKSPRWKPAMRDGQPVKTRFRQPVTVNLRDN